MDPHEQDEKARTTWSRIREASDVWDFGTSNKILILGAALIATAVVVFTTNSPAPKIPSNRLVIQNNTVTPTTTFGIDFRTSCWLAAISPDDIATIDWPCVERTAAGDDPTPYYSSRQLAVLLLAVRDSTYHSAPTNDSK